MQNYWHILSDSIVKHGVLISLIYCSFWIWLTITLTQVLATIQVSNCQKRAQTIVQQCRFNNTSKRDFIFLGCYRNNSSNVQTKFSIRLKDDAMKFRISSRVLLLKMYIVLYWWRCFVNPIYQHYWNKKTTRAKTIEQIK